MKPVYLIRHARNKARQWRISREDIEKTLTDADVTTPSVHNRVNYWRRWRGAWLRITAVEEENRIVVITATPRRKGPVT